MQTLYAINLLLHIAGGAVSLIAVVVPLLANKGGRAHRRAGWVFAISMAVVAATGFLLSVSWLAAPLVVKPMPPDATPQALVDRARSLRLTAPFFVMLSFLASYATWSGISALRSRAAGWVRAVFVAGVLISGAVVLGIGLIHQQVVFIIFGTLATAGAGRDLWALRRPRPVGRERVIAHLRSMLGGATAALTAFMVQTAGRLTDDPTLTVLLWTGPTIIGVTVTRTFTRRLRRRPVGLTSTDGPGAGRYGEVT